MQIRRIAIKTVDGLSPMPVSSAWVRDGIFVVGMDSEFAVYSQWRDESDSRVNQEIDTIDGRHLQEEDLLSIVQVNWHKICLFFSVMGGVILLSPIKLFHRIRKCGKCPAPPTLPV